MYFDAVVVKVETFLLFALDTLCLTIYWFVELGTSEGPEGFQTDFK